MNSPTLQGLRCASESVTCGYIQSRSRDSVDVLPDGKAEASAILRQLRRDNGLTQRDLGAKAGVPQSTIAEIEAGQ